MSAADYLLLRCLISVTNVENLILNAAQCKRALRQVCDFVASSSDGAAVVTPTSYDSPPAAACQNSKALPLLRMLHSLPFSNLALSSLNLPMCLLSLLIGVFSMSFPWSPVHSLPSNACKAYDLLSLLKSNGK